jgi:hypothetical protein
MYDPFVLDRIHFEQEERARRISVPRSRRRTARPAARRSAFAGVLPGRRGAQPAEC